MEPSTSTKNKTIIKIEETQLVRFINERILLAGTVGLTEDKFKRIRLINSMCAITAFLAFSIGYLFYRYTGLLQGILIPAMVEGTLFSFIIYLNSRKRYDSAALGLLIVHCMSALYFAFALGQLINISLIVVFLFGCCFLLYSKTSHRIIGLSAILLTLFLIELNAYYGVFKPIPMSISNQLLFRWIALPCFLFFDALVLLYYIRENKRLYLRVKMFVYKIAHELRTNLNNNSYLLLLLQDELNKENPSIKAIRKNYEQLAILNSSMGIIASNVLALGESEKGRKTESHTFNLKELLQNIVSLHLISAKPKGITIALKVDQQLPSLIVSDSNQLTDIVNNLLSNAIKYSYKHSRVIVSIDKLSDNFRLSVTNRCPAIPEKNLKNIFKEFVTSKTDRQIKGSGLGLFIVKDIVENFKGTYHVTSNEKETVFSVELPLIAGKLSDYTNNLSDLNYENISVFIAEDDQMSSLLLSRILKELGCKVASFTDGSQLLKGLAAADTLPDLIMLDDNMPVMGGMGTLLTIKSNNDYRDIPVIIASGMALKEIIDEFLEAGASAYINKPYSRQEIAYTISQHLQLVHAD